MINNKKVEVSKMKLPWTTEESFKLYFDIYLWYILFRFTL